MARHWPSSDSQPSRRFALGLLGALPLATGGVLASSEIAEATAGTSRGGPGVGAYDRFLKRLAEQDEFSGTVLLAHRGRPVLARAYGMADKERSIPNRVDTIYNLASTAKTFTGLAVVQLARKGRVSFHEPVGTYLDGYPDEVAKHVTVHQLLTHTSGLVNHILPGEGDNRVTNSVEEEMRLRSEGHRKAKPMFTPGTQHSYSSVGFSILGELVATVSKEKSFHKYVADNIFAPAEMTSTAYYTRPDWLTNKRIAHPYIYQNDGSRVDGVRNLDAGAVLNGGNGSNAARAFIGSGGGGAFSTASDLVRFSFALESGKLAGRAYSELFMGMKFPRKPRDDSDAATAGFAAYGPVASISGDQRLVGHGGGIAGGNTNWTIYRDSGWIGVILCNYDLDVGSIIAEERKAVLETPRSP
ncbi:serine hydrolase domain-containing protein [Actinomadura sp. 1N219]|uniref:serine hydrolase domain-containing protein n=1 Tax=Actinomadura sp. 1N219 TaxID=3375152 RepID=UPI0037A0F047